MLIGGALAGAVFATIEAGMALYPLIQQACARENATTSEIVRNVAAGTPTVLKVGERKEKERESRLPS